MDSTKKFFRKALTLVCVAAIAAAAAATGFGVSALSQGDRQKKSSAGYLNFETVTGDLGKIVIDKATNTLTSAAHFEDGNIATAYLNMTDGEGNRVSFTPGKGQLFSYDIEVLQGGVYLTPFLHDAYGWGICNAFMDLVMANHGVEIRVVTTEVDGETVTEEIRELPVGRYTGTVDLSLIEGIHYGQTAIDSLEIRMDSHAKVTLHEMKFIEPKMSYTVIPGKDIMNDFDPHSVPDGVTADKATATFTNSTDAMQDVFSTLYDGYPNRAQIGPDEGNLLYYDIEVHTGEVYLKPVTDSWAIGDALCNGINQAYGITKGSANLLPGRYTGALNLSNVWTTDIKTSEIMVRLFGGASVTVHALEFVTEDAVYQTEDVPGGDIMNDFNPEIVPDGVTADKTTATFTNSTDGMQDVFSVLYDGYPNRAQIGPNEGDLLYYDIEVHTGEVYVKPVIDSWAIGDALCNGINAAHNCSTGSANLRAGRYTGTLDLSAAWTADIKTSEIMVRLFGGASVTVHALKFVTMTDIPQTVDCRGGSLLSSYSTAGDIAALMMDPAEMTITSAEGYGKVTMHYAEGGILPGSAKIAYDFSIAMVEHTANDAAHEYHGRSYVHFVFPALSEEETKGINDALMNRIAENAGVSVWLDTLPAGDYSGTVDLSDVWNGKSAVSGLVFRLNNFAEVTVRSFAPVTETVVGDVNGDGTRNAADLAELQKYLMGVSSQLKEELGNVNGLDGIDVKDMIALKKILVADSLA